MLRAPLLDTARPRFARRVAVRLGVVLTAVTIGSAGLGVAQAQAATPTTHAATTKLPAAAKPASASVAAARAAFGKSILHEAARHAGAPYVYGASGPGAFDCSGFVRYVYAKMGISLAHSSFTQFSEVRHIPRSAALPGDIIFLNGLGHVGIYAGHGRMWDAPSPGGRVSLRPIYSSVYSVGRVNL